VTVIVKIYTKEMMLQYLNKSVYKKLKLMLIIEKHFISAKDVVLIGKKHM
jgi:hypothetical protein